MINKGTILVVEDTHASLKLITDILTAEGYQVRPADSGELALASVAAMPPELILLDIRMPGMDGFEVLRRLKVREESRDIPVILLSAVIEVEQRVEGLKLGAVDFISKPFQREELLVRVSNNLELFKLRARLERQAADLRLSNEQLRIEIDDHKDANEALTEKNAEMERFTYMISHDLKSPIVTVKTFLGYLEKDLAGGDSVRIEKDMLHIRTAADKMGALLDELLEMSRIGRMVNSPVRVMFRELVDEALGAVAGNIAERGVAVQVGDEDIALMGDRPRLAEIWQNLLENAVKFMGDQLFPRIELGVEHQGKNQVFYVRDNGIGIDPRDQRKIFGLFEKLNPGIEGTGIGLALVKRIVEWYQGKIWLESKGSGHGTCFRFTLPEAVKKGERN